MGASAGNPGLGSRKVSYSQVSEYGSFDSLLGEVRFANVRDVVDWGKSFKWVGDTWLFWEERTPLTRIGFST